MIRYPAEQRKDSPGAPYPVPMLLYGKFKLSVELSKREEKKKIQENQDCSPDKAPK